jgi:ferric-dicitrate binding protein FerR (iron transport regulator)
MNSSNHWNGIVLLLHKQLKGELSKQEQEMLDDWLAEDNNNPVLLQEILDQQVLTNELMEYESFHWIDGVDKLAANGVPVMSDEAVRRPIYWKFRYMMAAAAVLLLALTGYLWILSHHSKKDESKLDIVKQQNDLPPGKYRARLTLADGSTIILDSVNTDLLTRQGMATVRNKNGKLEYNSSGANSKNAAPAMNTLTTAKAETYQLMLSDGSKVWLNAQSSIRYPVTFSGDVRKVEVTGEAYFEVAHLEGHPFIVNANGMEVTVVGTHFNISCYENDAEIKTTLLEGKVKVGKGSSLTILVPGQQAELNKQTEKIVRKENVDLDEAVAWRFGYFQFSDADLQTVLRQLVRWYDVDISYEGKVPDMSFMGKIPRNSNLSNVLKILETNDVHFRIEGKKIVVSP